MNNKARNKAIRQLMCLRLKKETMVLRILAFSVTYALVSNILTHCSPLNLPPNVLDIMASIDETMRNCCYGVIASITFYLINAFYKNAYKKVDLYNDMYPSLYNLWLKIYQLVLAINNRQLDESLSNDTLHTSIITNLCGETNEDTTRKIDRDVSADMFHILYILWSDAIKDKSKFLEVYGNIVEREEYSKLNDKELDISVERLKEYVPKDEQIVKALPITIRDYDIERSVYLILKYKTDLASMVNKYSIYYYGNQRGVRTDAF